MIHKKLPSLKKEIAFTDDKDIKMLEQAYILNTSFMNSNFNFDWYMQTAILLHKEYNAPSDVVIASLMYKYFKISNMSDDEFISLFNKKTLTLVKLLGQFDDSPITINTKEKEKMIRSIVYDVRVTIIKLVEQLVALKYLDENMINSDEITRNAMEFYIPIGEVLGIYKLKHAFEELCFKKDKNYEDALRIREEVNSESKKAIVLLKNKLNKMLSEINKDYKSDFDNMELVVNTRSIYEIYEQAKQITASLSKVDRKKLIEILAFCSIKCLVDTRKQCYEALWIIHHFQHQGSFHDYLSWNDNNEYHSIHTKVFIKPNYHKNNEKDAYLVDVRICTKDMDKVNLYGIISDWDKENNLQDRLENKYSFYNKLLRVLNKEDLVNNFLKIVNNEEVKVKTKDKI